MIIDGHQSDEYTLEEFVDNVIMLADCDDYMDDTFFFNKVTLTKIALGAIELLGCWDCFSCGVDTFALGEDFYVQDDLWRTYGVEGVLCILCLEKRLGRPLEPADFKSPGIDRPPHFPHYVRSDRFKDRVGPQLKVMA